MPSKALEKEKKKEGPEVRRKGKVFVYTTKGKLVPFQKLERHEIKKSSKAIKEEKKFFREKGLVTPPFAPATFLDLYESNGYFMRSVDQVAQDVGGLGYMLTPKEGVDLKTDKKAQELKVKMDRLLLKPNDEDSLVQILKRMITDWGSIGWWSLEVVRNNIDQVAEMYYVPGHTVLVHESGNKYCQVRWAKGQKKHRWFKRFGYEKDVHKDSGEEKEKNGIAEDDRANEMIFYRNFYSRSDYYGTPNILGSVGAVITLIGIRDYNLSFFENYGVPSALVVLTGDWEEGSDKTIKEFIDTEIKGSENAHKTLVLQIPEEAGKLEWIPLESKKKQEEGSFKIYVKMQRDEVLVAYSMPPYKLGIAEEGALGGSSAKESNINYIYSMVYPLQYDLEFIFNGRILPTFYEKDKEGNFKPLFDFKLKGSDTRDLDAEAKRFFQFFTMAAVNPNQIIKHFDLGESYPEGNQYFVGSQFKPVGEELMEKLGSDQLALLQRIEQKQEELFERLAREERKL